MKEGLALPRRVLVLGDAQPLLAVPPPATDGGYVGWESKSQCEAAGEREEGRGVRREDKMLEPITYVTLEPWSNPKKQAT